MTRRVGLPLLVSLLALAATLAPGSPAVATTAGSSAVGTARPSSATALGPAGRGPGFGAALRAEWLKLRTVRSTWWTLIATFVLGAGLTILMCWGNADWLASPTPTSRRGPSSPGG